jgi:hypothetical protein
VIDVDPLLPADPPDAAVVENRLFFWGDSAVT